MGGGFMKMRWRDVVGKLTLHKINIGTYQIIAGNWDACGGHLRHRRDSHV